MPKYTFRCNPCNTDKQLFVNDKSIETLPCDKCGQPTTRLLPILGGSSQVKEVVDSHTGVRWSEDHQKTMEDRKRTYFWSVEVPRMVNSGVYRLETMLENKWVYYDDKGALVTRTKPPEAE